MVSPADQLTAMESLSVMAQVDPMPKLAALASEPVTFSMSKPSAPWLDSRVMRWLMLKERLKRSFSANATPNPYSYQSPSWMLPG
ncbi:hypothetical protein D3C85_1389460 [compost metagenome]